MGILRLRLPTQRIKNVPGRKTDISDAEWIAKLLRCGLIEGSFVPPLPIRKLRDLNRLRKKLIGSLTAEKNWIQKALESSNVKLGTVISDVFGVSGRNLLTRLIEQGYIDESDIEHRVKGQVKKKASQLADSLFGTMNEHQIYLILKSLKCIVFLEQEIQELDERIQTDSLSSFQEEVQLLQSMPGINQTTAAAIIAEIGVDMNRFPTAVHLAFWAGVAPGNHESAGKKSTRTILGNQHVKVALCEAAWAASRSRTCQLSVRFWKLASRRGKKKALLAIAHKILTYIYHMLSNKMKYIEASVV